MCQILKKPESYCLFSKGKVGKRITKITDRRITLFPTISKIYEMVLVNRLEKFSSQKGYFSQMQFGFQERVGCVEHRSLFWKQSHA